MDWINDPARWVENIPSPSPSSSFLQELQRAGGVNAKGQPNFRVVWGQDFDKAKIWSRHVEGAWFPRYWYRTVKKQKILTHPGLTIAPVVYEYDKIGIPRFFIESRLDPAVFNATGTASQVDSDGVVMREQVVDEADCWWTFLEVCDHKDGCCAYADKLNSNCHGVFTIPDNRHLNAVHAYRQWFDSLKGVSPSEPIPMDFKAKVYHEMREAERQNRERLQEELEYSTRHFVNTHFSTQLSDDPSVRANGKFHFLGMNGNGKVTKR